MEFWQAIPTIWRYFAAGFTVVIAVIASAHAVLYKRDSRSAALWAGLIWVMPLAGPVLYFLLGVNRIQRKAAYLRGGLGPYQAVPNPQGVAPDELEGRLNMVARLVDRVTQRPLLPGNRIEPLLDGDQAYPEMLRAIGEARESVTLASYIFDNDEAGRLFADALAAAVRRGVEVRVLIDDTGARYSWPSIVPRLRRLGVRVARFLPTFVPWRVMAINLRNHRKILVVDGQIGFTGGMNIRAGHVVGKAPRHPARDVQFRMEGPAVAQLQEVFAEDWLFTTGEALSGAKWFPPLSAAGEVIARAIADGPDEDFDALRITKLGGLAAAQSSVFIVTPYFLPDPTLISALNLAAMRGVEVNIILPGKSNLAYVHWATFAILWQMLERGCHVWLTPPPFDHSKFMVVDGSWSLMGSANWDPRSLRLNFEMNVECYSRQFASRLEDMARQKLEGARRVTLEEVDGRKFPIKLRDGVARLFTPFL